jgi:hypothetical protein
MKPGRNDPCPCGSGKKYKKCCLEKAATTETPILPAKVEPRFHPVALSYYTPGAVAEAHRPGGNVSIHPYVLAKLRDDPRLLEAAQPADRPRLLRIWRPSQLAAMSRDEIETQLALMGAPFNEAEFLSLTHDRHCAWEIGEVWGASLIQRNAMDAEFFGLAACELWRRLVPDRPSKEMLDDWLCEGYAWEAESKTLEALSVWWRLWENLRSRLRPQWKTLEEANRHLYESMSQHLGNWDVDFRMAALNGRDPRCAEIGIRYITDLTAARPEDEHRLTRQGDLAMLHFKLGHDLEAEQCCRQTIQEHPARAVGYITLADGWLRDSFRGAPDPDRINRAIALLEQALAYPVTDAKDYDLSERLADTRALLRDAAS